MVSEIVAGSREAESEFACFFLPRLKAFFRARALDAGWIDDLTQETLVRALGALRAGRLRDGSRLEAFVLGVARNQCAEAFRQSAKRPRATLEEAEAVAAASQAPAEETLSLRRELDTLSGENRKLLWLLLVEGYKPAEVGGMLNLSEEAVRQRKSRLLRRLAQALGIVAAAGKVTTAGIGATKNREEDGQD